MTALAVACGADPVVTDPETHDRWVALVSHAPHLVAAAMAARLAPSGVPADALRLAGGGLRDVTRIAAGDSALWTQILSANAGPVAEVVAAVAEDLAAVARLLARLPPGTHGAGAGVAAVTGLLDQGRAGAGRIPASTAASRGTSPWSRSSSPTSPASCPGCSTRPARPG